MNCFNCRWADVHVGNGLFESEIKDCVKDQLYNFLGDRDIPANGQIGKCPHYKKLTTKIQDDTLEYIKSYIEIYHYPPTVREMCDYFGRSLRSIKDRLDTLRKKKKIIYEDNKSRTMRLTNYKLKLIDIREVS